METKQFDLAHVVTAATGIMLTPDVGGMYRILGWMTGEDLMTHQIPRAFGPCQEALLRAFPQLAEIDRNSIGPHNWAQRLAELKEQYGDSFDVPKLGPQDYRAMDPMHEAVEMFGADRVIGVTIPED